ncbi:MAG: hypothetical protein JW888_10085 [Pirellulales bacterium]|nr:hypothetical protein [Pirellulales bacterium]
MSDYGTHLFVFALLSLLLITSVGLSAVWIALGRGHWFVRVVAVGATLSLLLFVPAYEPLVIGVVELLVAVPGLAIARRWRARAEGRPVWQFGLRDLLILTVVVAAIAAAGASVPGKVWQSWDFLLECLGMWPARPTMVPWGFFLILGGVGAVVTLLAAWIVLGRRRLWIRLIVLFVVFPAVMAVLGWIFKSGSLWPHQRSAAPWPATGPVAPSMTFDETLFMCSMLALVLMVAWLALLRASRFGREFREMAAPQGDAVGRRRPWLRWPARAGLVLLSLILFVPLGWTYGVLMTAPTVPETVLPEPNGYTQLVVLGKKLEKVTVPDDDPSLPQAQRAKPREFIDFERQHHELLVAAHRALDLPSLVPLTYEQSGFTARHDDIQHARQLARAMRAAGEAARINGDLDQATQWHVDTIRLGRAFARGGLIVDWLVGIAIEGIGTQDLDANVAAMRAALRQELLATLHELGEVGESFDACQLRDDLWTQNAFGWPGRLYYYIDRLTGQNAPTMEACGRAGERSRARFRLLLIELALEDYRETHGQYPERIEELRTIPADPFSGGPPKYGRTANGYLLYSVGPDGQDNGGATYGSNPSGDDVRFE